MLAALYCTLRTACCLPACLKVDVWIRLALLLTLLPVTFTKEEEGHLLFPEMESVEREREHLTPTNQPVFAFPSSSPLPTNLSSLSSPLAPHPYQPIFLLPPLPTNLSSLSSPLYQPCFPSPLAPHPYQSTCLPSPHPYTNPAFPRPYQPTCLPSPRPYTNQPVFPLLDPIPTNLSSLSSTPTNQPVFPLLTPSTSTLPTNLFSLTPSSSTLPTNLSSLSWTLLTNLSSLSSTPIPTNLSSLSLSRSSNNKRFI
ncbi:hypothetical protein Pcinc_024322 [Petrolisthes cinctipes]|uniref:Uncharacterized protein n=1 Tax=Petrolisthes cinctipes TaxID=88211 RepID=A0AAE1FBR9_PETCI|nr:hypothetical protein Pcinc_024322 [Petrolisthes cinctipes]